MIKRKKQNKSKEVQGHTNLKTGAVKQKK